jgi:hypothetical protein
MEFVCMIEDYITHYTRQDAQHANEFSADVSGSDINAPEKLIQVTQKALERAEYANHD